MKILVIGATGSVGRSVTKAAVEEGHEVTVFVRTPEKLGRTAQRVSVVAGGLDNVQGLERAMEGVEGVVSCAGAMKNRREMVDIFREGMENVVSAMKKRGVQRIVTINGAFTRVEGDRVGPVFGITRTVMRKVVPWIVRSNAAQLNVLSRSDREWTVVRSMWLHDGPRSGKVRGDEHRLPGKNLSRADLAEFMLAQLTDRTFVGKAPFAATP